MTTKPESIALFRYGLIAPLIIESLPRGELTRRALQISARLYDIPGSTRRQVSADTLLSWTLLYRRGGLDALTPKPRADRGSSRAVPPSTAAIVERLKRENPHRTGTSLLRDIAGQGGGEPGFSVATLYRFLRAKGLTERELLAQPQTHAFKKYEAALANQIWQSDMLFGPHVPVAAGGRRQQVYLQATLDDASRLIPHAQFYPDQGLDSFLDCLRQSVAARGLPSRLYMDNAKIYRSPQVSRIAASLGILIVHTPPYQPEGRGKIERFFRTVREQFMTVLRSPELDSLASLNERFWAWLDDYHRAEHGAIHATPLSRWQRDIEQIRQLAPSIELRRVFLHRADRLVRRDSTFLLRNRFFEAPPHLAGQRIEVRFDPLDPDRVEIHHGGRQECEARLVDPVANGITYRNSRRRQAAGNESRRADGNRPPWEE